MFYTESMLTCSVEGVLGVLESSPPSQSLFLSVGLVIPDERSRSCALQSGVGVRLLTCLQSHQALWKPRSMLPEEPLTRKG